MSKRRQEPRQLVHGQQVKPTWLDDHNGPRQNCRSKRIRRDSKTVIQNHVAASSNNFFFEQSDACRKTVNVVLATKGSKFPLCEDPRQR